MSPSANFLLHVPSEIRLLIFKHLLVVSHTDNPIGIIPRSCLPTTSDEIRPDPETAFTIINLIWRAVLSLLALFHMIVTAARREDDPATSTEERCELPATSILRACSLFHTEGSHLLYSSNTFQFFDAECFLDFMAEIGPQNERMLRHIEIDVRQDTQNLDTLHSLALRPTGILRNLINITLTTTTTIRQDQYERLLDNVEYEICRLCMVGAGYFMATFGLFMPDELTIEGFDMGFGFGLANQFVGPGTHHCSVKLKRANSPSKSVSVTGRPDMSHHILQRTVQGGDPDHLHLTRDQPS